MVEAPTPEKATVLVVDDEPYILQACSEALARVGHEVVTARDGATAMEAINSRPVDAAVLDIVLPDTDGLRLLEATRARNPNAVVVLITGFASVDTAMEAVRLGAYEYLRKPFAAEDLVRIVNRGLEDTRLRDRNASLVDELRRANLELLQQQAGLEERMRLAGDELAAFVELGKRLNEARSLNETLEDVLLTGVRLAHARAGAAYRVDGWPRRVRGVAAVGLAQTDIIRAEMSAGEGIIGAVAADGRARIENDLFAGALADDRHLAYLGVRAVLACPLSHEGELQGVLAFFDHHGAGFSDHSCAISACVSMKRRFKITVNKGFICA